MARLQMFHGIAIFLLLQTTFLTGHGSNALSLGKHTPPKTTSSASKGQQNPQVQQVAWTRRYVIAAAFLGVTATASSAANAACIAGDTSVDCIGSPKERIPGQRANRVDDDGNLVFDDIKLHQYLLRPQREDVVISTPNNLEEAIGILLDQRLALDSMEDFVRTGKLEDAGVILLAAMPKMTVAGRFLVWVLPKATRASALLEQTEAATRLVERTLALGIRGREGALTVAQLKVLSDLAQAKTSLDNLIKVARIGSEMIMVPVAME